MVLEKKQHYKVWLEIWEYKYMICFIIKIIKVMKIIKIIIKQSIYLKTIEINTS